MKKVILGLLAAMTIGIISCETSEPKKEKGIEIYVQQPNGEFSKLTEQEIQADLDAMVAEYQKVYGGGPRLYITQICSWGSTTLGGTCAYVNGHAFTTIHQNISSDPYHPILSYDTYQGLGHCLCLPPN